MGSRAGLDPRLAFLSHRPHHRQTAAATACRCRTQLVEQRAQYLRRGRVLVDRPRVVLWTKTVRDADGNTQTVPSARHGIGLRWRARYVDERGREHTKAFARKVDAQKWLNGQTAAVVSGTHVAPRDAQLTVEQWCDLWIEGYKVNREGTVRAARTHIRQIVAEFDGMPLSGVRPSRVKSWVAKLRADGMEQSYVYALHSRLSQILSDAVHDGVLGRNPCSRRTSPPMGKAKVYVATTEQVWAVHDAVPDHLRVAVLLGAFAGLRVAEVSGLRVSDVDFIRGVVHPKQQWPDKPLKTEGSDQPIPIPRDLALLLSASVQAYPSEMMVTNGPAPTSVGRGSSNGRFATPARRSTGCPRDSLSTTCATTWRRC
jgi:integrase